MTSILVMTETRSLADAKAHLSELIDLVSQTGEHVEITRRGRPCALIVGIDEYEGMLETLDLMSIPGATDEMRRADAEIASGDYVTAEHLREKYLKKK